MSKTNESLSDLLDDQCSSADLDHLFNELAVGEQEAVNKWHRYNAVSALLKGEYSANASTDFCKSISAKIAEEPTIVSVPRPFQVKTIPVTAEIRKIGGGFAIAASVAFATFFSVQTLQVSSNLSPVNENSASIEQTTSNSLVANNSSSLMTNDSLEQIELEEFNDAFMQQARQSEQDSIAPFATSVGGEYVKTIRFSAEQWQQILQRAVHRQSAIEAAKKVKIETEVLESSNLNADEDGE